MLIDTHTHLDFDRFDQDRTRVIERALEEGVGAMLTIGVDLESSIASMKLAEEYKQVYAAVGVHPHDAKKARDEDFDQIQEMLQHPKVVAIGEVGLDYHYDYSPREVQRRVFRRFLDMSLEIEMPLIIHTRDADEDVIPLIREKSRAGWNGVFHCFAGDTTMADTLVKMGFLISFTGNITFKNSRSLKVATHVPLEKLMVETDCPFMAPVPHRGKRNEPAFVKLVAEKIAEHKHVPYEHVAELTTANAINLFKLPIGE